MAIKTDCKSYRRFGIEIEINTPSGEIKPLAKKEAPEGARYVANIIQKTTKQRVEIHGWHLTHNNNCWLVKPDSSCGIEVCSPIMKGWQDLKSLLEVIQAFSEDSVIKADRRCSFHIHVNVGDLRVTELGAVLGHWVKCEPVFFDTVPSFRKKNRYCQYIGISDLFEHNVRYDPDDIINMLSSVKYYSVNTFHLKKEKRKTIEFRIAENDICLDPFMAKNWVRLILHFIECTRKPFPKPYKEGDQWSGLLWLDPHDVFKLLGFDRPDLSDGLQQVKQWLIGRLSVNGYDSKLTGVWSNAARQVAYSQVQEIMQANEMEYGYYMPRDPLYHLYDDKFAI